MNHSSVFTKGFLLLFAILLLLIFCTPKISAHSGRTDSSGGHNCYVGSCAGTYHYHNGGGGASNNFNEMTQGIDAGEEYAENENRARIESSATAEGNHEGRDDGLAGKTASNTEDNSVEHCSQEIKFTNPVSERFKSAFHTGYKFTCNGIYYDAYKLAYQAANTAALIEYEALKSKEAELKKAADNKSRNGFMLASGAVGAAVFGAAAFSRRYS
jgi:hypothetical protein